MSQSIKNAMRVLRGLRDPERYKPKAVRHIWQRRAEPGGIIVTKYRRYMLHPTKGWQPLSGTTITRDKVFRRTLFTKYAQETVVG